VNQGITCVLGCAQRGYHLADCEGDCWGCLPAIARHGAVCEGCHHRLWSIFTEEPRPGLTVTAWMLGHIAAPISRPIDFSPQGSGDGPPAPLRPAVVDWVADWRNHLLGWVEVVCDHTGLTGPASSNDPERLRSWLAVHHVTIECADYIGPLMDELGEDIQTAHGLAPWRKPPPGQPKAIPCRCVTRHLDRSDPPPLTLYDQENSDDLICVRCNKAWEPEEFATWAGLVGAAGRQLVQAENRAKKAEQKRRREQRESAA
jgi:hypothetical protein